ncbi:MAG TPA: hypothetical protein VH276_05880 [Solirubrobacteraceae bacterium]|jgi:hypothetical protein|nr:hypothetical protein [Solirubrobacteraceae bacterium]
MPTEALNVVPVEHEARVVYRVVATADRESSELVDSFKSSQMLGLPPRQGSPEARFNLIHSGISCFRTRRQAEKQALRWGLGDYVAEVQLQPGAGICLAEWGSRGHMTIWADAVKLRDMTVDIMAVRQET